MTPTQNTIPLRSIPPKIWILGMVWTMIQWMAPVGVLLINWLTRWQDPPDWVMIGEVAFACAFGGAAAYWREYKALIQLPPSWAQARELASHVQREKTVETVEQKFGPERLVTTTVKETSVGTAVDALPKP
jgi:hypothetical protein